MLFTALRAIAGCRVGSCQGKRRRGAKRRRKEESQVEIKERGSKIEIAVGEGELAVRSSNRETERKRK